MKNQTGEGSGSVPDIWADFFLFSMMSHKEAETFRLFLHFIQKL